MNKLIASNGIMRVTKGSFAVAAALVFLCVLYFFACVAPVSAYANEVRIEVTQEDFDNYNNGKGSTEDSNAIWAALREAKEAPASQYTVVVVKKGTYPIKRSLQMYSNTKLILEDGVTLVRPDGNRTNDDGSIGNPFVNYGLIYNHGSLPKAVKQSLQDQGISDPTWHNIGGYNLSNNITIEGHGSATIDGGNISAATDTGDLVRFDHAQNIKVTGVTFKNVYGAHHLEFVGVKNGTISGCSFTGFRRLKGHEKDRDYGRECIQLDSCWADNTSKLSDPNKASDAWASGTLIDGTNCQNITVDGCNFYNISSALGQHHWSSDSRYKSSSNIKITNNTITGGMSDKLLRHGINIGGLDNVTVTGNTITGYFLRGIHVFHAKNAVIKNNMLNGCYAGIYAREAATSTVIENNTIKNSAWGAVCATSSAKPSSLSRNTIAGSKKYGIYVTATSVGSIASNNISSAKKYGLYIKGKVSGITGNRITSPGVGIAIASSSTSSISKNTIASPGSYGILTSGSSKVASISKNTVSQAKKAGICTSGKSKVTTISKNKVTKAKKYGIYLGSKANKAKVKKNTVQVHKKKNGIKKAKKVKAKLSGNKVKKW